MNIFLKTSIGAALVAGAGYFYYNSTHKKVEYKEPIKQIQQIVAPNPDPDLPEGEYITLARSSKMTDAGVESIPFGVTVQKIGEENDKYLIKYDKVILPVSPEILTSKQKAGILAQERAKELEKAWLDSLRFESPNSQLKKKKVETFYVTPDYRNIDAKIAEYKDKIKVLEFKAKSSERKISAHTPVIRYYQLEIQKLEQLKR